MAGVPWLHDTRIALIVTRQRNPAVALIDQALALQASRCGPAACTVTVAEILVFSRALGAQRRHALDELIEALIMMPITPQVVHSDGARPRIYADDPRAWHSA